MDKIENFVLMFEVETPVISFGFLTLDAILAALIFQETDDLEMAHNNIPLARTDGVWHGSAAMFTPSFENGTAEFVRDIKMPELESGLWQHPKKTKHPLFVDKQRGDWKSEISAYETFSASQVRWFGRGDIETVINLLNRSLFFVGAKGRQGYGRVSNGTGLAEIIADDFSLEYKGSPARPIPLDVWDGWGKSKPARLAATAGAPPYFKTGRQLCAVPTTRFFRGA